MYCLVCAYFGTWLRNWRLQVRMQTRLWIPLRGPHHLLRRSIGWSRIYQHGQRQRNSLRHAEMSIGLGLAKYPQSSSDTRSFTDAHSSFLSSLISAQILVEKEAFFNKNNILLILFISLHVICNEQLLPKFHLYILGRIVLNCSMSMHNLNLEQVLGRQLLRLLLVVLPVSRTSNTTGSFVRGKNSRHITSNMIQMWWEH